MRIQTALAVAAAMAFSIAGCSAQQEPDAARGGTESADSRASTDTPIAAIQPVAVELFTSQGCSSCPPADRLIAELADSDDLVVITRPVTYWDRLGWKDTLARPENTALQRAYATGPAGRGRPYTPQAVVDGRYGLVGSRRGELMDRIAEARETAADAALAVEPSGEGGYTLRLSGETQAPAMVTLVALDSEETVAIGRGENGGRSVTYTNIVRDERSIGRWQGGAASWTLDPASLAAADTDRHAVIVRQGEAGPILAARYL